MRPTFTEWGIHAHAWFVETDMSVMCTQVFTILVCRSYIFFASMVTSTHIQYRRWMNRATRCLRCIQERHIVHVRILYNHCSTTLSPQIDRSSVPGFTQSPRKCWSIFVHVRFMETHWLADWLIDRRVSDVSGTDSHSFVWCSTTSCPFLPSSCCVTVHTCMLFLPLKYHSCWP